MQPGLPRLNKAFRPVVAVVEQRRDRRAGMGCGGRLHHDGQRSALPHRHLIASGRSVPGNHGLHERRVQAAFSIDLHGFADEEHRSPPARVGVFARDEFISTDAAHVDHQPQQVFHGVAQQFGCADGPIDALVVDDLRFHLRREPLRHVRLPPGGCRFDIVMCQRHNRVSLPAQISAFGGIVGKPLVAVACVELEAVGVDVDRRDLGHTAAQLEIWPCHTVDVRLLFECPLQRNSGP